VITPDASGEIDPFSESPWLVYRVGLRMLSGWNSTDTSGASACDDTMESEARVQYQCSMQRVTSPVDLNPLWFHWRQALDLLVSQSQVGTDDALIVGIISCDVDQRHRQQDDEHGECALGEQRHPGARPK
jgi:hypothetical protein